MSAGKKQPNLLLEFWTMKQSTQHCTATPKWKFSWNNCHWKWCHTKGARR